MFIVRLFCLLPAFLIAGCAPASLPCTEGGLRGEYALSYEGRLYLVSLGDGASGQFADGSGAHWPLKWQFIPEHNFVELDLETRAADVLSGLMGLQRPPGVILTERGVIALSPACSKDGRAERLELSEDRGLEFVRN